MWKIKGKQQIVKKITPIFIITFLACLIYYPILDNQLLDFWDDQWVVMNHFTEGGINVQNLLQIFTQFYHGQYAPFNEYLYLSIYSGFGYNSVVFHLASLVLHLINSILVYLLIRKILFLSQRAEACEINYISFFTSLIFCIHPLNVESVAWMSASKVLIYSLFYLISTYTFLLYVETKKRQYYILTLLLYICSFLGKEQAVIFPIWMCILFCLIDNSVSKKKVFIIVLPFFILSILLGIITIISQSVYIQGFWLNNSIYTLEQRLVFSCYSYLEYLYKIIFPFNLSYLYPFPMTIGSILPNWLLLYPLILVTIVLTLWQFIRQWPVLLGLSLFTVYIALSLHIIPLSRFAIVADRYAYISIIGISFIISFYTTKYYYKIRNKNKYIYYVFVISYLLYLGIYSHNRTNVWYDVDTLKSDIRELLQERDKSKINKLYE
ncbi:MAG: hypothetical protein WC679_13965 [Bacteroidales bacterium]|jgi:hypothetical protein